MTPERWLHIKSLLNAALERAPTDREAFLDGACAGDEGLRKDLAALITAAEKAGDFMESPAFELMADSLEETDSLAGRSFGPYQIISLLGAGGMGEVYLAEDKRLHRQIALKVLPANYTTDPERVKRFQQEARAASALNHPSIITIYEIGEIESRHFIVTEFIEGETLRRQMMGTQIEVREAVRIATHSASALAAAHAAGIIHRDIKPENIMLRSDGIVKVLDFGLAKLTDRVPEGVDVATLVETHEGMIMGTSFYMSPEQARGLTVDPRTDIWSLGVVLYEIVAGQVPFEGETSSDVIVSILTRKPAPITKYNPKMPQELEWIIEKCLRKDRDERYQTTKELLSDLKSLKRKLEFAEDFDHLRSSAGDPSRRISSGSNEGSIGPSKSQQSNPESIINSAVNEKEPDRETTVARNVVSHSETRRTIPRAKILISLGLIALLLGIAYLWLKRTSQSNKNGGLKSPTFTQLTYQPGTEFFPSLSPDGKSVAYAGRNSGNWDIYVHRVGGANPINLTQNSPVDDSQPAYSPDGERIVFRSERDGGGIYIMGATGESVRRVSDFGYSPSWSPDGTQILVGTEKIPQPSTRPTRSQLWKINIESGDRRMISEGDALQPHYSPNQRRIVYWSRPSKAGQREDIWTIPADGGEAIRVTSGATIDLNPVWSPDGKYIYFSSSRGGSMNIWRVPVDQSSGVATGDAEAVTTIGAATSALHLSLSRDGRRLVYIAQQDIRNLRKIAFDPSSGKTEGEPQWITRGSLQLWFPDPSPDGEWLAACSRGQQRHVYILRPDGTELRDLTDDDYRHDGWPRWSPDGKRIAFTSRRTGDYELWLINRDGSELKQITQSKGGHYSPWSPDGNSIAYSTHWPKNECIVIQPNQNASAIRPLPPLNDPTISFEAWAWSSDGKKLAGIKHLPNGLHSGIGVYEEATGKYEWFTDFGDWPVWLKDNRRLLFVSQGKVFLFDSASRNYQPVLTVTDQDVDIGSPSLSRDNRTLFFTFVAAESDVWLMTLD